LGNYPFVLNYFCLLKIIYIFNAKEIGSNCKIYQQVSIGFNGYELPVLGNNVTICSGAKIIGGIKINNNVIIGANAVVVNDIENNCVVAGVPAKIINKINRSNISKYKQHYLDTTIL